MVRSSKGRVQKSMKTLHSLRIWDMAASNLPVYINSYFRTPNILEHSSINMGVCYLSSKRYWVSNPHIFPST